MLNEKYPLFHIVGPSFCSCHGFPNGAHSATVGSLLSQSSDVVALIDFAEERNIPLLSLFPFFELIPVVRDWMRETGIDTDRWKISANSFTIPDTRSPQQSSIRVLFLFDTLNPDIGAAPIFFLEAKVDNFAEFYLQLGPSVAALHENALDLLLASDHQQTVFVF